MLNFFGSKQDRQGTRFSRREFLSVGTLAVGGLSLPDILRARAETGGAQG